MSNTFEIKYLFELYPDVDFADEFVECQEIVENHKTVEVQATERKWGHILDSINRERKIQSIILREYEVKIIVSRNIDVPILEYADYITLTTTEGESFLIYDVAATYENIAGSLNYVVNLTFKRADNNVINHLASDNVLAYKTGLTADVNEIEYTVDNPYYAFNSVDFEIGNPIHPDVDSIIFKVPFTELSNNIDINDYFYLHTNNSDYNDYIDVDSYHINYAKCYDKDSDYVYFYSKDELYLSPTFTPLTANYILLDNEPDKNLPPAAIIALITDKTMISIIYTFINPFYNKIITPIEGISAPDGIQENQKVYAYDVCRFKVWLKTSELWKIEYLNYSLPEDILLTLSDATEIIPVQTKDIYKRNENDSLIDLHEFDFEILYNNKVVNIYR